MHNRQEDVKMELSKLKKKIEERQNNLNWLNSRVPNGHRFNWKCNKGHWEEK